MVEDENLEDEDYVSIKAEAYEDLMADEPMMTSLPPVATSPHSATAEPTPSEMVRDIIKINR